jgi:hypothetical protein
MSQTPQKLQTVHIHIAGDICPVQIDIPAKMGGEEIQRSSKGSLHFTPNSTEVITEAELAYIRTKYPLLARSIQVIKQGAVAKIQKVPMPLESVDEDKGKSGKYKGGK